MLIKSLKELWVSVLTFRRSIGSLWKLGSREILFALVSWGEVLKWIKLLKIVHQWELVKLWKQKVYTYSYWFSVLFLHLFLILKLNFWQTQNVQISCYFVFWGFLHFPSPSVPWSKLKGNNLPPHINFCGKFSSNFPHDEKNNLVIFPYIAHNSGKIVKQLNSAAVQTFQR